MNKFLLKTCIIFIAVVFLSLLVGEQVLANGWQFESGLGLPPSLLGIDPTAGPAEFVAYVFILALGSAGVLAMLFIIIGGIRYMAAAGNPGTQSDAKDQILSAILGLLLLLATVLILSTISPQFTSLENPTLPDAGIPEGEPSGGSGALTDAEKIYALCPGLSGQDLLDCLDAHGYFTTVSGASCTEICQTEDDDVEDFIVFGPGIYFCKCSGPLGGPPSVEVECTTVPGATSMAECKAVCVTAGSYCTESHVGASCYSVGNLCGPAVCPIASGGTCEPAPEDGPGMFKCCMPEQNWYVCCVPL